MAVVDDGSVAVPNIDTQRMPGCVLVPLGISVAQGVIDFSSLVFFKLAIQHFVRIRISCKYHHPAGDLVQAVDDPYF